MTEIDRLKALIEHLGRSNPHDDGEFVSALEEAFEQIGMTNQEAANKLHVSRPTVARWRAGNNLPHAIMRPRVISFLRRQAANKIKGLLQ